MDNYAQDVPGCIYVVWSSRDNTWIIVRSSRKPTDNIHIHILEIY